MYEHRRWIPKPCLRISPELYLPHKQYDAVITWPKDGLYKRRIQSLPRFSSVALSSEFNCKASSPFSYRPSTILYMLQFCSMFIHTNLHAFVLVFILSFILSFCSHNYRTSTISYGKNVYYYWCYLTHCSSRIVQLRTHGSGTDLCKRTSVQWDSSRTKLLHWLTNWTQSISIKLHCTSKNHHISQVTIKEHKQ